MPSRRSATRASTSPPAYQKGQAVARMAGLPVPDGVKLYKKGALQRSVSHACFPTSAAPAAATPPQIAAPRAKARPTDALAAPAPAAQALAFAPPPPSAAPGAATPLQRAPCSQTAPAAARGLRCAGRSAAAQFRWCSGFSSCGTCARPGGSSPACKSAQVGGLAGSQVLGDSGCSTLLHHGTLVGAAPPWHAHLWGHKVHCVLSASPASTLQAGLLPGARSFCCSWSRTAGLCPNRPLAEVTYPWEEDGCVCSSCSLKGMFAGEQPLPVLTLTYTPFSWVPWACNPIFKAQFAMRYNSLALALCHAAQT